MLKRVKDNFGKGVARIKWFSTVFSERLKIEMAIVKLLYRSDEMDNRRAELLKEIGKRVYEMRENQERNILKDRVVQEAVSKIEKLDKEITELNRRISEIGQVGA